MAMRAFSRLVRKHVTATELNTTRVGAASAALRRSEIALASCSGPFLHFPHVDREANPEPGGG